MKSLNPEVIRALTPIFLATVGAAIVIVALVSSGEQENTKLTAAMGLAGTAIAGASGLAQSTKSELNSNTGIPNSKNR